MDKFWLKVSKDGDCWEWQGVKDNDGYGRFYDGGKTHAAHRVAYQLSKGFIESGLVIRHRCNNRCCCNPEHLITGSQADNMNDKRLSRIAKLASKCGISVDMVHSIRNRLSLGLYAKAIAKELGVSPDAVFMVKYS